MTLIFNISSITPTTGGGGSTPNIMSLNINPGTKPISVYATNTVDGYAPVLVAGVTSSIDANITAGNIRKDVTILGVTGTVEAGSVAPVGKYMVVNGVAMLQDNSLTNRFDGIVEVAENGMRNALNGRSGFNTSVIFPDLTTVTTNSCHNAFYDCWNIRPEVSFPKLTTITGNNAFYYGFGSCYNITKASFPNLVDSGNRAFVNCFGLCTNLTTIEFNSLTNVGISALYNFTGGCTNFSNFYAPNLTNVAASGMYLALSGLKNLKSLSLPKLTNVANSGCGSMCQYSGIESVNLPSLASVGANGFYYTFRQCNNLTEVVIPNLTSMTGVYQSTSFNGTFSYCPNLTTVSFNSLSYVESDWSFYQMLAGDNGVTVHFPAALQPQIGSWSQVTSGFGGTNTTVLFDL